MAKPSGTQSSLAFNVKRASPELVPPAGPTPAEFKEVSDIDDQEGLRFQIPLIFFYENDGSSRDPAKVIKAALAAALVAYYPFAGRLRERPGRRLVVECNGEGVLFIEADTDVSLEEFGEDIYPPIPCLDELIFDVPGYEDLFNTPLLVFQVTRLKCGGFIVAVRVNHIMTDAIGIIQFFNAVKEMVCDARLSTQPVWERHCLSARDPPQVTCVHHELDNKIGLTTGTIIEPTNLVHKSFLFGPREISAMQRWIPPHLTKSSTFDVLTSCIWRCRTIALEPNPSDLVPLICVVNARPRLNPPLPKGYYGNGMAYPVALCTAKELLSNPLDYATDLIRKAKARVTDEYMKSLVDLLAIKGKPRVITSKYSFQVSDLTRSGFAQVEFGWGRPVYGGTARKAKSFASFYLSSKSKKGEWRIVLPISLPAPAMERFAREIRFMFRKFPEQPFNGSGSSSFISSSL